MSRDWLILSDKRPVSGVTVADVVKAVSAETGVQCDMIRSHKRDSVTASARHIAMFLAWEMTGFSRVRIGKALGGFDHSSVIYGCRQISDKLIKDEELRATVSECRSRVISFSPGPCRQGGG